MAASQPVSANATFYQPRLLRLRPAAQDDGFPTAQPPPAVLLRALAHANDAGFGGHSGPRARREAAADEAARSSSESSAGHATYGDWPFPAWSHDEERSQRLHQADQRLAGGGVTGFGGSSGPAAACGGMRRPGVPVGGHGAASGGGGGSGGFGGSGIGGGDGFDGGDGFGVGSQIAPGSARGAATHPAAWATGSLSHIPSEEPVGPHPSSQQFRRPNADSAAWEEPHGTALGRDSAQHRDASHGGASERYHGHATPAHRAAPAQASSAHAAGDAHPAHGMGQPMPEHNTAHAPPSLPFAPRPSAPARVLVPFAHDCGVLGLAQGSARCGAPKENPRENCKHNSNDNSTGQHKTRKFKEYSNASSNKTAAVLLRCVHGCGILGLAQHSPS